MSVLDECREWHGDRNVAGYGRKAINGKRHYTHRFAYEWVHGPIPKGVFVCHTCDNPPCVNPNHLFLGRPKDNSRDMLDKGRSLQGTKHPLVKLTENDVLYIRATSESAPTLAKKYGVTKETIYSIRKRINWRHL